MDNNDDLLAWQMGQLRRQGYTTAARGHGRAGASWSSYWATLISATVENAAPTNVVLTFPTAKTELTDADFTIAGFTISSASWTGAALTLVVTPAVLFYHGNLTITFVKTGETATVTNNVAVDNTVGWYVAGDGSSTYVTKDGSDFVSVWKDLSGNNRPLLQVDGALQPLWTSNGVVFNGDRLVAEYTLNQPVYISLVATVTYLTNSAILDGNNINSGKLRTINVPRNQIAVYAGTAYACDKDITYGVDQIIELGLNGASSFININNTGKATGNPGTANMGGIVIGTNGGGGEASQITVKEVIIRSSELSLYLYYKNKYSL